MIGNFKKQMILKQIKQDAEVSVTALRFFEKTKKQSFKDFADYFIARIIRLKKITHE